jgi:hypothetical protein
MGAIPSFRLCPVVDIKALETFLLPSAQIHRLWRANQNVKMGTNRVPIFIFAALSSPAQIRFLLE